MPPLKKKKQSPEDYEDIFLDIAQHCQKLENLEIMGCKKYVMLNNIVYLNNNLL